MILKLITDQGGSFDKYYEPVFTSKQTKSCWKIAGSQIKALLAYMQESVEAEPHWVTIPTAFGST